MPHAYLLYVVLKKKTRVNLYMYMCNYGELLKMRWEDEYT